MIRNATKLVMIAVGIVLALGLFAGLFGPLADFAPLFAVLIGLGILFLFCLWIYRWILGNQSGWLMLTSIEQAVRLNLPLPQIVGAMAQQETGVVGQELQLAAMSLQRGDSLATALNSISAFPPGVIEQIAAAERIGRLPQILAGIVRRRRDRIMRRSERVTMFSLYPLVLVVVLVGVLSLMMVFVMPKIQQVFHDFKVSLPPITQFVIWDYVTIGPWIFILLTLMIAAAMMPRKWWRHLLDRLPWIGTMRFDRDLGDAMEFTAEAIESGRPIGASLHEAAQLTGNIPLRQRLEKWIDAMSWGESIDKSARIAGLPSLVVGMLATATQTPDLAPLLRFLSRYYRTRFSRSLLFLQAAIIPATTILMGIVVGTVELSMFMPLIRLIEVLTPRGPLWRL